MKTLRGIAEWLRRRPRRIGHVAVPVPVDARRERSRADREPSPNPNRAGVRRASPATSSSRPPALAADPDADVLVRAQPFAITDDGRRRRRGAGHARSRSSAARPRASSQPDEPLGRADGLIHLEPLAFEPPQRHAEDALRARQGARSRAARPGSSRRPATAGASDAAIGTSARLPRGGRRGAPEERRQGAADAARARGRSRPRRGSRELAEHAPRRARGRRRVASRSATRAVCAAPCSSSAPRTSRRSAPSLVIGSTSSVVLVTGGARGITARVAVALARALPVPPRARRPLAAARAPRRTPSSPACADAPALRRVLVARGEPQAPAQIEADVAAHPRRARDPRHARRDRAPPAPRSPTTPSTCATARRSARSSTSVYARHGRLDGVIHGAGVIEDKLLARQDARLVRPRLRHQGRRRADARREAPRRRAVRRRSSPASRAPSATAARPTTPRPTTRSTSSRCHLDARCRAASSRSTGARGAAPAWSRPSSSASTSGAASG